MSSWNRFVLILLFSLGESLILSSLHRRILVPSPLRHSTWSEDEVAAARSFKIVTCSATSCAAKRKALSLDPYATFSAFWERLEVAGLLNTVSIEETSCLGACQRSPCVAVEHQDFEGTVALAGMEPSEFVDRVFYGVTDEADVERVFGILKNAIHAMAADGSDDSDEYENENYV
jgi:(2Fe-2S) ferredoxin